MHAIVFEAAATAIYAQSDPSGIWPRPPLPPPPCPSRVHQVAAPEASAGHQRISVAPTFSPESHHQHLLHPEVAPASPGPAARFSHRISQ